MSLRGFDGERGLSLYGLDDWITGHDGDDYWEGAQDEGGREYGGPWICNWCLMGQHAACTSGERCDCNAGRGDCWGHLPPRKVKLVHDVGETVRRSATWDNGRQLTTASHRNSTMPVSPTALGDGAGRHSEDGREKANAPLPSPIAIPNIEDIHMPKTENLPSLAPRSFQDAMDFSKLLAESNFVPKDFKGKPGDILAAIQMGYEVGLSPMAALQNIAVINGRPSIWGDAALALVKASGLLAHHNEYWEPDGTAVCEVGRKGHLTPEGKQHITVVKFGKKDAQAAGLLSKQTYQQYQARMFQWRARGFGLRDEFPDVLKGLITREEADDYSASQTTITVIPESQPHSDSQHEARNEERAVTTSGSGTSADNLETESHVDKSVRTGELDMERAAQSHPLAEEDRGQGNPGVGEPSAMGRAVRKSLEAGQSDPAPEEGTAPDAPADNDEKKMLGELYKIASKKVGSVKAFNHLKSKGLWPIADLKKSQIEQCAEELQSL